MRCDYCGHMTPLPMLRFIPDGKVEGVINVPKSRAQCVECSRSGNDRNKVEVASDDAPF